MTLFSYFLEKLATWMSTHLKDLSTVSAADWSSIEEGVHTYANDVGVRHSYGSGYPSWVSLKNLMNKKTGDVAIADGDVVYFGLTDTKMLMISNYSGTITKSAYEEIGNFVTLEYVNEVTNRLQSSVLSETSGDVVGYDFIKDLATLNWTEFDDDYGIYAYDAEATGSTPKYQFISSYSSIKQISSATIPTGKTAILAVKKRAKPVIVAAVNPGQWTTSDLTVDDYYVNG